MGDKRSCEGLSYRFRYSAVFVAIFVLLNLAAPSIGQSDVGASYLASEDGFLFSEHIKEAESWLSSKGTLRRGVWRKDRFLFSGESAGSEVKQISHVQEDGFERSMVQYYTVKGVRRVIEFRDVPTGSFILVTYGIMDERAEENQISYLNFRIWLGKQLLKEIRIQNDKEWKEMTVPLGLFSFLDRPGIFRFEIFSDSDKPISFYFDGEIIE